MCNNCIHKPVCSKYIAMGDVNSCEHYKEERKGRWITYYTARNDWTECSVCNTVGSPFWKVCPVCGADMKGGLIMEKKPFVFKVDEQTTEETLEPVLKAMKLVDDPPGTKIINIKLPSIPDIRDYRGTEDA